MTLQSHVGSFSAGVGAATTTVAVTGVGFTPIAIIFWWSGRSESTDTIGRASHWRGFGAAVSSTIRAAITSSSIDAQTAGDTQMGHDEASCILSIDATPAIDGQIDLQSMDADGFTLVVDDQMPRDLRVHYLALGGDSLTNANIGRFTAAGTAPVDQDVTGVGFQPDFVLFFSGGQASDPPFAASGSRMALGAAVSSSQQGAWAGVGRNGVGTTVAGSYSTAGECIATLNTLATLVELRADFVSFLSDGFRINWAERGSTARIFYLALKGGNYRVDNLLTRTDGNDIAETSFGFQPTSALFVSNGQAESTSDTIQTEDRLSIGAFSSTSARGAQGTLDETALADTEVTTAIELDEVYVNIKTDSTIDGLMDVKSIDSDGFTMVMDNADPGAAFAWYMAFGPAAAAVGTLTVNVSETITLTESATVTTSAPQVSASETVTLSEAATVVISTAQVSISETVTLTEAAAVVVSDPQVSAAETITLAEAVTLQLITTISASETVTLTEATEQVLAFVVIASETVTLTESATVTPLLLAGVSVGETVTLTDLAAIATVVTITVIGSVKGVKTTGTIRG